jgi:hypothetical protein
VKIKKQNISLRQLFRRKLENAEVLPDALVKSKLMREVARREFLRFNPARFNIFYIGGIIIAGITTAVLLVSPNENYPNSGNAGSKTGLNITHADSFIEVPAGVPVRIPTVKTQLNNITPKNDVVSQVHNRTGNNTTNSINSQKTNKAITSNISKSLSHNGLAATGTSLIDPNALTGCAPFKLRFHNKSTSYDSCRWTFGDGGYSTERDPEWIFDVEGEYKVVLQVFRDNRKSSSSTATVIVHPKPHAQFEITPDKAILPKDEIHFVNYSANSVQFKWDFGDGSSSESYEPSHIYSKFGNYNIRLIVYSDWGCSDSATVFNAFSRSEYFISFPNAFIANSQGPSGGYYSSKSDEAAPVFHPSYSGVSDYHLKIFSKLGITIFESNDINLGWDGYLKGQLCEPGVYIWKVRGQYRNGEQFIKMGDVTLLKN